jgi:hypothetical protein
VSPPRLLDLGRLAAVFAGGLLSCSAPDVAFRVTVSLDPGLRSTCVLMLVSDSGSGVVLERSKGALIAKKSGILVAVVRDDLPETVSLQVIGFSDDACTIATVPAELSEIAQERFPSVGVKDLALTVKREVTMSIDNDNDGSPEGVDCDDRDPQRRPGLAEVCTDAKDNDCDQFSDCGDGTCTGKQCKKEGSSCSDLGACTEAACSDFIDNDNDGTVDCGDADCNEKACANRGTCATGACRGALNEQMLCNDGVDNDNDSLTDCLDSDCNLQPCRDALACTVGEICSNLTCGGGVFSVCTQSANRCLSPSGTCREPDGGCEYVSLAPTVGCDDGRACTVNDTCDGDGGCTGIQRECLRPPPGSCWEAAGTCSEATDGGCTYTIAVGRLSCTDNAACTVNDACLEDGGCLGVPLDCSNATPPDECQVSAGATCVAGTCPFMPRAGPCDGGTCAAGVCVPTTDAGRIDSGVVDGGGALDAGASFVAPSNVTLTDINSVTAAAHFNVTCSSIISLNPVGIQATEFCPVPTLPAFKLVTQSNGPTLVLFVMDRFTIAPGATLKVNRGTVGGTGDRAVVFAVKGDATINGTLDVSNQDGFVGLDYLFESGAGGEGPFCAASVPGGTVASRSGGGHGGSFGNAGGSGGRGANVGGSGASGPPPSGNDTLIPLRGGCPGSRGGAAFASRYGRAGGAVQLWVRGPLVVNGAILASGGGGLAAAVEGGGGGGGGSGGGILIEATTVNLGASAILAANGGGGAEGSAYAYGNGGQNGTVGVSTAPGGTGANACGGFGGRGGGRAGGATAGEAAGLSTSCMFENLGGGGGGGGSVGRIRINALNPCTIAMGARMSPPPTSLQMSCAR